MSTLVLPSSGIGLKTITGTNWFHTKGLSGYDGLHRNEYHYLDTSLCCPCPCGGSSCGSCRKKKEASCTSGTCGITKTGPPNADTDALITSQVHTAVNTLNTATTVVPTTTTVTAVPVTTVSTAGTTVLGAPVKIATVAQPTTAVVTTTTPVTTTLVTKGGTAVPYTATKNSDGSITHTWVNPDGSTQSVTTTPDAVGAAAAANIIGKSITTGGGGNLTNVTTGSDPSVQQQDDYCSTEPSGAKVAHKMVSVLQPDGTGGVYATPVGVPYNCDSVLNGFGRGVANSLLYENIVQAGSCKGGCGGGGCSSCGGGGGSECPPVFIDPYFLITLSPNRDPISRLEEPFTLGANATYSQGDNVRHIFLTKGNRYFFKYAPQNINWQGCYCINECSFIPPDFDNYIYFTSKVSTNGNPSQPYPGLPIIGMWNSVWIDVQRSLPKTLFIVNNRFPNTYITVVIDQAQVGLAYT